MKNLCKYTKLFLGTPLSQNDYAIQTFDTFFKVLTSDGVKIERILEIGTSGGGLSIFLGLYCYITNIPFVTYDIRNGISKKIRNLFEVMGVKFIVKDIFESVDEVRIFLNGKGTSVLLCDGGNKIKEFIQFASLIKEGDFILAHDYAKNVDSFRSNMKGKLWDWLEIQEKDIEDSCVKYNLKGFMEDEFNKCAWTCKIKEKV
jgi:hypothetical protein